MKRMAIIGAGAIGSILGGYITKAGEDITLIDASWREHIEAMRRHGLKISGVRGEHLINVKALFIDELDQLEGKIDILFIAVKSYDTEKALTFMKPYLAKDAWVISCQNGVNEDVIIPIVGRDNTIGCVVTYGGAVWEPGHVVESPAGKVGCTVGELDGQVTPRIKEIARITGLCHETAITSDIWGERWNKLLGNGIGNCLTAITGVKLVDLLQNGSARRIQVKIAVEIIQVAEALGHKIESVFGLSAELWKKSASHILPEVDECLAKHSSLPFADVPSSMLQDTIKGRPSEIDYLNGYVVKRGREVGVPTPVNEIIVGLVRGVDSGQWKPDLNKMETLLKLIS